jgi:hypothetical protein
MLLEQKLNVQDVINFIRSYEPREKQILKNCEDGAVAMEICRSIDNGLFLHSCDFCGNITGVAFGKLNADGTIHCIGLCLNTKKISLKRFVQIAKAKYGDKLKMITGFRAKRDGIVRYREI